MDFSTSNTKGYQILGNRTRKGQMALALTMESKIKFLFKYLFL